MAGAWRTFRELHLDRRLRGRGRDGVGAGERLVDAAGPTRDVEVVIDERAVHEDVLHPALRARVAAVDLDEVRPDHVGGRARHRQHVREVRLGRAFVDPDRAQDGGRRTDRQAGVAGVDGCRGRGHLTGTQRVPVAEVAGRGRAVLEPRRRLGQAGTARVDAGDREDIARWRRVGLGEQLEAGDGRRLHLPAEHDVDGGTGDRHVIGADQATPHAAGPGDDVEVVVDQRPLDEDVEHPPARSDRVVELGEVEAHPGLRLRGRQLPGEVRSLRPPVRPNAAEHRGGRAGGDGRVGQRDRPRGGADLCGAHRGSVAQRVRRRRGVGLPVGLPAAPAPPASTRRTGTGSSTLPAGAIGTAAAHTIATTSAPSLIFPTAALRLA